MNGSIVTLIIRWLYCGGERLYGDLNCDVTILPRWKYCHNIMLFATCVAQETSTRYRRGQSLCQHRYVKSPQDQQRGFACPARSVMAYGKIHTARRW